VRHVGEILLGEMGVRGGGGGGSGVKAVGQSWVISLQTILERCAS